MFQNLFNEASQSINLIISVDNITIGYTTDGKLQVLDNGISTSNIANLAVTNAKISDMDASKLTGTISIPIDNVSINTDRIFVSDANAGAPSITFKNDQDTGIFRYANNQIGFSVGGNHMLTIDPSRVTIQSGGMDIYGQLYVDTDIILGLGLLKINYGGVALDPTLTFGNDSNGFYYSGTNTVSFASDNVETLRMFKNEIECFTNFKALTLTATGSIAGDNIICNTITTAANVTIGGVLIIPIGSSSAPSLHFAGDATTGIYQPTAFYLSITSNSIETTRFNSSLIQFLAPISTNNTINCTNLYCSSVLSSNGS